MYLKVVSKFTVFMTSFGQKNGFFWDLSKFYMTLIL